MERGTSPRRTRPHGRCDTARNLLPTTVCATAFHLRRAETKSKRGLSCRGSQTTEIAPIGPKARRTSIETFTLRAAARISSPLDHTRYLTGAPDRLEAPERMPTGRYRPAALRPRPRHLRCKLRPLPQPEGTGKHECGSTNLRRGHRHPACASPRSQPPSARATISAI